jgi:hypothetical protein
MSLKTILSKYAEKPNSLFLRFFITFFCASLPFAIFYALLIAFAGMSVNFNGKDIYGIKAIVVEICFAPFLALMFALFAYLGFSLGNFILKGFIYFLPNRK